MAVVEVKKYGVVELPKELMGTDAERLAYNTTGLVIGSTFAVFANKKFVTGYTWDGTDWNEV